MASSTGAAEEADMEFELSREVTAVEAGLAWFKLTFGCLFLVIALAAVGKMFHVRNVFEIKARSPYLVMLSGLSLIGLLGLAVYISAFHLFQNLAYDVRKVYIGLYFFGFTFSASFWSRVVRLGLTFCPRFKRRCPGLMSERLLVSLSIAIGFASVSMPIYKAHTINGPKESTRFRDDQLTQLFFCQVMLLTVTMLLIPIVWRVDDLFKISTELFAATIIQIMQTGGNALRKKYGSEQAEHWVNRDNLLFIGTIVLLGIMIIDPLRRLKFNPMSNTFPELVRAHDSRRQRFQRTTSKGQVSAPTERGSYLESQDPQPISSMDIATPRRNRWSYDDVAAVPAIAHAFRAFAFRALCEDSVLFLEEVSRYHNGDFSMCAPHNRCQKVAFLVIVARFVTNGAADEVDISGTDRKRILELSRNDGETFCMMEEHDRRNVFRHAYAEVRRMLETNLLQRFTETDEFKDQELRAPPPPPARHRQGRGSSRRLLDGDSATVVVAVPGFFRVHPGFDEEQPFEFSPAI